MRARSSRARATGADLEIGTFTGDSAPAVALALPDDGSALACDVSDGLSLARKR